MRTPSTIASCDGLTEWALRVAAALGVIGVIATAGCTSQGMTAGCKELATCGGNPVGMWNVGSICEADPQPSYMVPQATPDQVAAQNPNLTPAQTSSASGDWCYGLIYLPDSLAMGSPPLVALSLWHQAAPFAGGGVNFHHNPPPVGDTYDVNLAFYIRDTAHFAQRCLQAYGATPKCSELQASMVQFFNNSPNYGDPVCTDASNGDGCDCNYKFSSVGGDFGNWVVEQTSPPRLVLFSNSGGVFTGTFCVTGNSMQLSGFEGQGLFGQSGLHEMLLNVQTGGGGT
jgi:hypothetical protein